MIYEFIADYLSRGKDNNVNRASAANMCVRRRWYQHHGHEGTPLTPRKVINFQLGDLTERVMLYYIKQALTGPGKLYSEVRLGDVIGSIHFQGKELEIYQQKTFSFTLENNQKVTAHVDGLGKRNADGKWELIEIKSAADWGFEGFVDNKPLDYLKQAHASMMTDECRALEIDQVRFFFLKKNTGNIWDRLYSFDETIANNVLKEFLLATKKEAPERPHGLVAETYYKKPTGRKVAGFPCSYCPFLKQCHGEHEKEFKSGKPVYVFTSKKEK
jgi:hypothetical protein